MVRVMVNNAKFMSTYYKKTGKKYLTSNRLLIVQAVQSGTLMFIGDVLAQIVVEKTPIKKLNFTRMIKFGCLGLFLVGPVMGTWYSFLAANITKGNNYVLGLKKVAIDQLLFQPCLLLVMLTIINVLNCKSKDQIKEEIKLKYFTILLNNYKLWPVTNFINLGFVPLKYQILVNQTVAVFWNIYLSNKMQAVAK